MSQLLNRSQYEDQFRQFGLPVPDILHSGVYEFYDNYDCQVADIIGLIRYEVTYRGIETDDNEWEHHQFSISTSTNVNGGSGPQRFDYKTGMAHRCHRVRNSLPGWKHGKGKTITQQGNESAIRPGIALVMHSLVSDASFGDESFSNFCDSLGYSDDSISALNVYKACGETGK